MRPALSFFAAGWPETVITADPPGWHSFRTCWRAIEDEMASILSGSVPLIENSGGTGPHHGDAAIRTEGG